MKQRRCSTGFGSQCPPDETHVRVYFLQQGTTEFDAHAFFHHLKTKSWKNDQGALVKNWKRLAWNWIWQRSWISVKHYKEHPDDIVM